MTTLFTGARIHGTTATALAVEHGVITWLGDAAHAPPAPARFELGGAHVAPAFVDAHVHATSAGLLRTGLDLTKAESREEVLDAVRDRAGTDEVLWGHGWDETNWPGNRPPTRTELDAAAGSTPVYLSRIDVHSALASTALLARVPEARTAAGWSADGPLTRDAHHHVRNAFGDSVAPDQRRAAQLEFLHHAASRGIACVHECGGPDISGARDFRDLLALEGKLPRVVGYWGAAGDAPAGARGKAGDFFVDGAFGSRTAALAAPYADAPHTSGSRYLDAGRIAAHLVACTEQGMQAGFHVIGDAAAAEVVAGFQRAEKVVGEHALGAARHRLEHLEMVTAEQAAELARLGVVASVQPLFDATWGGPDGMYAQRLGVERAKGLNPFALLAAAGVTLAFGSDAPVTPVDPWATVRAAVNHRTPGSGLTREAAFEAHTAGGWAAAGERGGVLEVGAPATFAVWRDETCLRTVLDGRMIYQRSESEGAGAVWTEERAQARGTSAEHATREDGV
ncbi:MAG: amidohydrolase family protein [Actinophytocola sp.]|uniref:amidohydrolase n=1 Tax=Actinophytocola sp. TaxID=1872138 RepID=UPI001326AFCD|nr:amidohydrolase family protein [Actinophytocola sp.]MPZ79392.1 amidohydrolase family protein [Actinophytocola sp.]